MRDRWSSGTQKVTSLFFVLAHAPVRRTSLRQRTRQEADVEQGVAVGVCRSSIY